MLDVAVHPIFYNYNIKQQQNGSSTAVLLLHIVPFVWMVHQLGAPYLCLDFLFCWVVGYGLLNRGFLFLAYQVPHSFVIESESGFQVRQFHQTSTGIREQLVDILASLSRHLCERKPFLIELFLSKLPFDYSVFLCIDLVANYVGHDIISSVLLDVVDPDIKVVVGLATGHIIHQKYCI